MIAKVGFVKVLDKQEIWWELDIAVKPEFQGKGIGKKIIREAIKKFNKKNIFLEVHPKNPALKLYQSVGFIEYSKKSTEHGPRIIMDYKV